MMRWLRSKPDFNTTKTRERDRGSAISQFRDNLPINLRFLDNILMIRGLIVAGILLTELSTAAGAVDFLPPQVMNANIDWDGARRSVSQIRSLNSAVAAIDIEFQDAILVRLNAAVSRYFPGISKSSVPVLLPLDPEAALRGAQNNEHEAPTNGFRRQFFYAGSTGYDAAFSLSPGFAADITDRQPKEDLSILISGFALLYQLDAPAGASVAPAKDLAAAYPGIRRVWLESNVRYTFERYGVTYVVSMLCLEGTARGRWISCRDADRIIARFLNQLHIAGGSPQRVTAEPINTVDRPTAASADFSYGRPGQLIRNTGSGGGNGREDWTVYAKVHFPLAQAPAYANSQSFMHWGNCDLTGRTSRSSEKGAPYRCRINDKPLIFDESAPENRSYPWRDNFCEHRGYFVGQCPNGRGHQGQDIRPATCKLRNEGADRCQPYQDAVVAVRDGMILRALRTQSLYLIVNAPGERLRFRYLHMNPKHLDDNGLVNGRMVREGETLGMAGNFDRFENGTTYHVHFDMQVPTRDGWVYVNPYTTLVTAYERLIGGRGQMTDDASAPSARNPNTSDSAEPSAVGEGSAISGESEPPAGASATPARGISALPENPLGLARDAARERETEKKIERANLQCKAGVSARRGSRGCEPRASRHRGGAKHGVRKLGRKISPARHRTGRVGSNLQSRHDRVEARHLGVRRAQ